MSRENMKREFDSIYRLIEDNGGSLYLKTENKKKKFEVVTGKYENRPKKGIKRLTVKKNIHYTRDTWPQSQHNRTRDSYSNSIRNWYRQQPNLQPTYPSPQEIFNQLRQSESSWSFYCRLRDDLLDYPGSWRPSIKRQLPTSTVWYGVRLKNGYSCLPFGIRIDAQLIIHFGMLANENRQPFCVENNRAEYAHRLGKDLDKTISETKWKNGELVVPLSELYPKKYNQVLDTFRWFIDKFEESNKGDNEFIRNASIEDLYAELETDCSPRPDSSVQAKRRLSSSKDRPHQKRFRDKITMVYKKKCAVSGSDLNIVLQAAHIQPYQGWESNAVQNGILLRSDLHLLFDAHLATFKYENEELIFLVHSSIIDEYYRSFDRKAVFLPNEPRYWPCKNLLEVHNQMFFSLLPTVIF